MNFKLPCSLSELKALVPTYNYRSEAEFQAIDQRLQGKKALTKNDLRAFIAWKSPRTKSKVEANDDATVLQVSRIAIAMPEPYLAVHTLTVLAGVGISVASAIMAFVNPDVHAVMDRHTVRALGEKNLYLGTWTVRDYEEYRSFLLKHEYKMSLRELEQGLFVYSGTKLGNL